MHQLIYCFLFVSIVFAWFNAHCSGFIIAKSFNFNVFSEQQYICPDIWNIFKLFLYINLYHKVTKNEKNTSKRKTKQKTFLCWIWRHLNIILEKVQNGTTSTGWQTKSVFFFQILLFFLSFKCWIIVRFDYSKYL
jgi:hypothetical protein